MRRRDFITLLSGTAVAWPLPTRAQQQPTGLRRVGVLISYNKDDQEVQDWLATFHDTLGKLGWNSGAKYKV